MNIALFGGTFDPVHIGHIRVAETVLDKLSVEQVWFIPAGVPSHKEETMFSFAQRIAFLRDMVKDKPHFSVYEADIREKEKSYTVLLVRELQERFPQHHFYFIIGSDNVVKLQSWREYQTLLQMIEFIVVSRETDDRSLWGKLDYFHLLKFVDMPVCNVSSSEIRERVREMVAVAL